MALEAARAARNSSSGLQVTLDYAFSAINIALATFLVVKVKGNRTANLLAIGMVGTAVAFNLQSHAAFHDHRRPPGRLHRRCGTTSASTSSPGSPTSSRCSCSPTDPSTARGDRT